MTIRVELLLHITFGTCVNSTISWLSGTGVTSVFKAFIFFSPNKTVRYLLGKNAGHTIQFFNARCI